MCEGVRGAKAQLIYTPRATVKVLMSAPNSHTLPPSPASPVQQQRVNAHHARDLETLLYLWPEFCCDWMVLTMWAWSNIFRLTPECAREKGLRELAGG